MKEFIRIMLVGIFLFAFSPSAYAGSCSCIIPTSNILGNSTTPGSGGIIQDFSGSINLPANTGWWQCHYACDSESVSSVGSQTIATLACQKFVPNGTEILSFSKPNPGFPGNYYDNRYVNVRHIGKLINTPATTTTVWKCPSGWVADNQPGDITTNGRCKRLAGYITVSTLPANGAQVILPPTASGVQWGFTWGNQIWVWSSPTNGGVPVATPITTPAVCKF